MNSSEIKKWAIVVADETNFIDRYNEGDLIMTFRGTFMEVMQYVSRYDDGDVDVYDYQEGLELGNE